MQFAVERSSVAGRAVLVVTGELDVATAPLLGASVEALLGDEPPREGVVVDLTGTTFLDSTGCRQLARAARSAKAAGVPVAVACPRSNTSVRRVLDLLDLEALVPVVESPAGDPS